MLELSVSMNSLFCYCRVILKMNLSLLVVSHFWRFIFFLMYAVANLFLLFFVLSNFVLSFVKISLDTMESKIRPNLFFAGEVMFYISGACLELFVQVQHKKCIFGRY